ncbi:MAG TPA: hypothetical protein P5087_00755 [Eubacteriales bacterium]|nr:hypothetical protein [Eubacteriales bacterium]
MEFNSVIETILSLSSGENLLLVGGAIVCCLLTGLIKKLLPKLKIDLTHSFDPCAVLPFAFGAVISGVASFILKFSSAGEQISFVLVETLTMGALSMAIYKLVSSINGTSLKQLLKSDVFSLFYNQLLTLTDAKKRLVSGELSEKQFVGEICTIAANASAIYAENATDEIKKENLIALLGGIIDSDTIDKVIDSLHVSLSKMFNG